MINLGNLQLCTTCCNEHMTNGSSFAFAHYGSSCYEILLTNLHWQQAQDKCTQLGGKVLNITSSEEHIYIKQLLQHYGLKQEIWLLGYDYPPHLVNATCAVLEPQLDGRWIVSQCGLIADVTRGVICEYGNIQKELLYL
ncbi:hypothetical protein DPMN_123056 [Dreissena polymorpha]|uniref:C-type lectin domain-containing protein n=1 Tax=Dreissena polymorpha TaxID=45954 RepID=A0A9D4GSZ9_DREPO|nr:hypothetical protein DPMN_123056 [Dreissena polymorpha]